MSYKNFVIKTGLLFTVWLGLCSLPAHGAPASVPEEWQLKYDSGVQAYRAGQYQAALQAFEPLTASIPNCAEAQYYYGMALAQLGHYNAARQAYQHAIDSSPQSHVAELAQQGMGYLPQTTSQDMDLPPRPGQNHTSVSAANPTTGMDPDMMQMMMLMGSMGGNNSGGGMNGMMMLPMLQQLMGNKAGAIPPQGQANQNAMSPDVIKTMMMNQMMQGLDMFGSKNNDDN